MKHIETRIKSHYKVYRIGLTTTTIFIFLFLNFPPLYAQTQYGSKQDLYNQIEMFPTMQENQHVLKVGEAEFRLWYRLEQLDISMFDRNTYVIARDYIINRPDFTWQRTFGKNIEAPDFFGTGFINNHGDVKIEVRFGCWDCTGKGLELYSLKLELID